MLTVPIEVGRVVRYGDPDWVDPESPDFDHKSDRGATYQLKPVVSAQPDRLVQKLVEQAKQWQREDNEEPRDRFFALLNMEQRSE